MDLNDFEVDEAGLAAAVSMFGDPGDIADEDIDGGPLHEGSCEGEGGEEEEPEHDPEVTSDWEPGLVPVPKEPVPKVHIPKGVAPAAPKKAPPAAKSASPAESAIVPSNSVSNPQEWRKFTNMLKQKQEHRPHHSI